MTSSEGKTVETVAVLNSHTGRRSEKTAVIERGDMWYCLNMWITAHIFRQSLLENIHSVTLSCLHEKWLIVVKWKTEWMSDRQFKKVTEFVGPSLLWCRRGVGGGDYRSYLTIWQALLMECIGALMCPSAVVSEVFLVWPFALCYRWFLNCWFVQHTYLFF